MAIKYIFVRMPVDTYKQYEDKQTQMLEDIRQYTGNNRIKLPMTRVFKAVINLNQNRIVVNMDKLVGLAKRRRNNGLF